ncbi:hypothetical protein EXM22_15365 [Oceanispirochaeta crateris]|uniref:Nitroreductase family protein n=1 Tax=Oceanispirochaeta crateris TaxID=2518645 RepID=A0A5C1QPM1_9SPIO|nr:nitroreductase family protein [Oceanispirochaeta crateris]QEN09288.1 hypothetical protein EXM22_15365 [Oceanispirochaeta crateris]
MKSKKIHNPYIGDPGYACFGCAPKDLNARGLGLTFSLDGKTLISDWTPQDSFQGAQGILHGGIQATLMDEIASWYVFVFCGTAGATKSLQVEYRSPALMKYAPFHLQAELKQNSGKTAEIMIRLMDCHSTICSEGLAVYALFSESLARGRFGFPGREAFFKRPEVSTKSQNTSNDPLVKKFQARRSVRSFSTKSVSLQDIRDCIAIAATAPSGANCQPWTFALVTSGELKRKIRKEAEHVESLFYERESTQDWREDLSDLRTDASKAFLEDAPCLIILFLQKFGRGRDGRKINHYYPGESLGMAAGFLISALHMKGYSTLPYTPAPMNFLMEILDRPDNERPYLILPVGYARDGWMPPVLEKKDLDKILVEYGDSH